MPSRPILALASLAAAVLIGTAGISSALDFEDGDRVILLGDAFLERDLRYGHLEAALTAGTGEAEVTFRNFGWSGDTPFGHARSYFGPPQEGLDRLTAQVAEWKPTLAVLCYGSQLAFPEAETDLATFLDGYRALLDLLEKNSPGVRFVVLSPPPLENLGGHFPDQSENNTRLAGVRDALAAMAQERGAEFADIHGALPQVETPRTENGVHLTEQGYADAAFALAAQLGLPAYDPAATAELRAAILEKNAHAFAQLRPTNETYLRGFRKHEQGQNAAELPQFTPLIEAAEAKIQSLLQGQ